MFDGSVQLFGPITLHWAYALMGALLVLFVVRVAQRFVEGGGLP